MLAHYPWERDPLASNAFDYLLMFDIGGIDIQPLLHHWLNQATPQATVQYPDASYLDFWHDGGAITQVFAEGRPAYRARMTEWLMRPSHRRLFATRLLRMDLSRIKGSKKMEHRCGHEPAASAGICVRLHQRQSGHAMKNHAQAPIS